MRSPTASVIDAGSASCTTVFASPPNGGASDVIHGVRVDDPFRWLEDRSTPTVAAWIGAENRRAHSILGSIPVRAKLVGELQGMRAQHQWLKMPRLRGGKYLYQRRDEQQERGAIFEYDPATKQERTVLSLDDTELVAYDWSETQDGSKLVFLMSPHGNDVFEARIYDVRAQKWLADRVPGLRFGYPFWNTEGNGFYYTWSPMPDPSLSTNQRAARSDIRFHALGTDPATDAVLRPPTGTDGLFEFPYPSSDGKWLIAVRMLSSAERKVYLRDLRPGKKDDWHEITPPDAHGRFDCVFASDGLVVIMDENAPHGRAFHVDPEKLDRASWREIVPERQDATMVDVSSVGDYLYFQYLKDAETVYEVHRNDGTLVKTLEPPALGTLTSLGGTLTNDEASIAFSTYTQPYQVYLLRPPTFGLTPFPPGFDGLDEEKYVTEKVSYTSPDGTRAPIFIVRARTTPPRSSSPLILYGYGAFGTNTYPHYKKGLQVGLDRGGVYAEAVIRGGAEYGSAWHVAGMGRGRKNVYDDFLAAAEHLQREKWTTRDRMVLRGASAGGLLVTVAETERPDLFRAVIAEVPVTDMVRFTIPKDSVQLSLKEFGSPAVPQEFAVLFRYSPYHRIRPGVKYPWTLMMSGDADDRVDPMHTRKYAAALQAADPCDRVLVRTELSAAHGPASATLQVQWLADLYAFALDAVGYAGN